MFWKNEEDFKRFLEELKKFEKATFDIVEARDKVLGRSWNNSTDLVNDEDISSISEIDTENGKVEILANSHAGDRDSSIPFAYYYTVGWEEILRDELRREKEEAARRAEEEKRRLQEERVKNRELRKEVEIEELKRLLKKHTIVAAKELVSMGVNMELVNDEE
jgi:hypothetical protein